MYIRNLLSVIGFVILSFVFIICPPKTQTASNLQTVTTTTDTTIRVDYIDSFGNISIATDKGYATVIKMIENGHSVLESYYDENGKPIAASSGQFAVAKTWSNGQNTKVTYLDEYGQPTYNASGFVSKVQKYNKNGQKSSEIYLNLEGEPIANHRGEYGKSFEYDEAGRRVKITSLNAKGEPTINSSGYCYMVRTFNNDDSVNTELYFDTSGNAVKLSDGQYGVKYINGKTIKIDENGNPIYSINTILNLYPWLTVALGVILVCLIACLPQIGRGVFLFIFIFFIVYETLIGRGAGDIKIELTPFWSYKQFFVNYSVRLEIINNI